MPFANAMNPGGGCCGDCDETLCVFFRSGTIDAAVAGLTVTFVHRGEDGATITETASTDARGKACLPIARGVPYLVSLDYEGVVFTREVVPDCGTIVAFCATAILVTLTDAATGGGVAGGAVTISDRTGASIQGVTTGVTGADGTVLVGPFAAPGDFFLGRLGLGSNGRVTIAYDDLASTQPAPIPDAYCRGAVRFVHCKARVRIATSPGAIVSADAASFAPDPDDGGAYVYKALVPDVLTDTIELPADVTFTAHRDGTYKDVCATATVHCGDDLALDLTQFDWGPCYFDPNLTIHGPFCADQGCAAGPGPGGRGLAPRSIQVRPRSLGGRNFFGDDEGVWITLTLVPEFHDAVFPAQMTGYHYDSGCRGPQGNFLSFGSGWLNRIAYGDSCQIPYGSTRITVGGTAKNFRYDRFGGPDCTTAAPPCDQPVFPGCAASGTIAGILGYTHRDGSLCATRSTTAGGGGPLCAIADFTMAGTDHSFDVELPYGSFDAVTFRVDVREAPCP